MPATEVRLAQGWNERLGDDDGTFHNMVHTAPDVPAPVSWRSGARILYTWPLISLGAFDCWPGDERWRSENLVDEGHVIAFPGTAVEIIQDGHEPVVADAHRVVLYNRNQTYRRRLVTRIGDHCTYLVVAPELLEQLMTSGVAAIRDPDRRPFEHPVLAVTRREHLEHRTILQLLAEPGGADPLDLQERLVRLVGRALSSTDVTRRARRPRRADTEREHRRIVEDFRALLATDVGEPMSLEDVAREVGASVFHVSRLFRDRVGVSLHAYRDELRLRSALPAVLAGDRALTDVALEHGYASPSHFADRFRARYGMAPSRLRGTLSKTSSIAAIR